MRKAEKILLEDLKNPAIKQMVLDHLADLEKYNERRNPDRTFSNSVESEIVIIGLESAHVSGTQRRPILPLISFRWTQARSWSSKGAQVVLTRQPETSDDTFKLAEKLVRKMKDELIKENRFFEKSSSFQLWREEKARELILEGFYRKKKV